MDETELRARYAGTFREYASGERDPLRKERYAQLEMEAELARGNPAGMSKRGEALKLHPELDNLPACAAATLAAAKAWGDK